MKWIVTLYNYDITLEVVARKVEANTQLTLSSASVNLNVVDDIKTEEFEILLHTVMKGDKGDPGNHPYISLERLREYLFRVTFDRLPEDNGGDSPVVGGCSSYVKDGKLQTNLDWDYDETASFIVRTRDFEGQSFIQGMDDGSLNDEQIAQLPYRVHRGINNNGIKLAAHVIYNDWQWTGCGERSINLTRLPFLVLTKVKSMATLESDLDGVLDNLYCPEGLSALGYLLQLIVTDGTTTYAIVPPTSEGESYEVIDITSCPKMTNFRPVGRATVARTDSDIQEHPTGIERYNMMPCELSDLRFTKAYEAPTRLSEFIGLRGTDKDSTDAELLAIYNDARAEYLDRQRDGKTWQTMESAIYGDKLESLWIQENWEDNILESGVSKAYVDSEIERVEGEIPDVSGIATKTELQEETERAIGAEQDLGERIDDIEGDLEAEISRATDAEGNLSTAIENEATRAGNAEAGLGNRITAIEDKIPSEATSTNKLADKGFVNSSIATNTAYFRGTWDLVEDLGLTKDATEEQIASALATVITTVTNNDYSFVFYNDPTTGIAEYYDRYKYSTEDGWGFEYRLNNSSFTAAQWAAINSGLTSSDKTALDAALAFIATFGNIVTHNVSEFATAAQGAKADSAYQKPTTGIPSSDLSSGVQTSLGKADSAVQDSNYVHTDNNYTDEEKEKLEGIEEGAEKNAANTVIDADYVHTDNNYTDEDAEKVSEVNAKITSFPAIDKNLNLQTEVTIDTTGATNGFAYGTYSGSTITGHTGSITGIGSQNYHMASTYAWAKLTFTMPRRGTLTVTCANNGEGTYDFGLISQLDQNLAKSTTADTSTTLLKKSFTNQQVVEDVVYENVSAGQHFITVKFKKDGSSDSGMDRFVVMAMKIEALAEGILTNIDDDSQYPLVTGNIGNAQTPVYLEGGKFKEADKYAGGTKVTLNGTEQGGTDATIYAPATTGTGGYRLVSNGSGAPVWQQPTMHLSCTTAAGTTTKTASCSNFKLLTGVRVVVKMANSHTSATSPTLSIASTSSKTMYWIADGQPITASTAWEAGDYLDCIYDGTYWRCSILGKGGKVDDVQLDGVSQVVNKVANIQTKTPEQITVGDIITHDASEFQTALTFASATDISNYIQ